MIFAKKNKSYKRINNVNPNGINAEINMFKSLNKYFLGKVMTNEEKNTFNINFGKSENITSIKKIFHVGGRRKKNDMIIIFDNGEKFGVSYKKSLPRTVQSWSSVKTWCEKIGEDNFKTLINNFYPIVAEKVKEKIKSGRFFFGVSLHLSSVKSKEKYLLSDYIDIDETVFHMDKDTDCVYQSDHLQENTFLDFLNSEKMYLRTNIQKLKPLYIDIRYVYCDTTKSNNGAQMFYVFEHDDFSNCNKNIFNMKEYISNFENKDIKLKTYYESQFYKDNSRITTNMLLNKCKEYNIVLYF